MKTIRAVVILVCLLSFVQSYAHAQVWNADTIIARVNRVSEQDSSRRLNFKMTLNSDSSYSYGTIWWKPGCIAVAMSDTLNDQTPSTEIISDGTTQWLYMQAGNTVMVYAAQGASGLFGPVDAFRFSPKKLRAGSVDSVVGDTIAWVRLAPLSEKTKYSSLLVKVSLKDYRVQELCIFNKNGSSGKFSFAYAGVNEVFSDDLFRFDMDKHPGVKVDDSRK